jgi:hypothetical protein
MRVAKIDHNLRKEIDWYINRVPNDVYFRGFEDNLKQMESVAIHVLPRFP